MTLFVSMPGRRYEISEVYILALSFIIIFGVTRIAMQVNKKLKEKNRNKEIKISNPRCGGIQLSDDNGVNYIIMHI